MKTIGKYKLTGLLGKGGMGRVYKIEYPVTGKVGALKRFQTAREMITALDRLETDWRHKKGNICSAPAVFLDISDMKQTRVSCRKEPVKQPAKSAAGVFNLTPLMTPGSYIQNDFVPVKEACIHDRATGLVWQQSGSLYPVNHAVAFHYIDHLNAITFGGSDTWRLPTIDELLTLLIPLPEQEGHCIESLFDTTQIFLWSADTCSYISAWSVNIEMGFVGHNDQSSFYYVRAVSDYFFL